QRAVAELQRDCIIGRIEAWNTSTTGRDVNLGAAPPRVMDQRHAERLLGLRRRHPKGERKGVLTRCSAPRQPAQATSQYKSPHAAILGLFGPPDKAGPTVIHVCIHSRLRTVLAGGGT